MKTAEEIQAKISELETELNALLDRSGDVDQMAMTLRRRSVLMGRIDALKWALGLR